MCGCKLIRSQCVASFYSHSLLQILTKLSLNLKKRNACTHACVKNLDHYITLRDFPDEIFISRIASQFRSRKKSVKVVSTFSIRQPGHIKIVTCHMISADSFFIRCFVVLFSLLAGPAQRSALAWSRSTSIIYTNAG